MSFQVIFAMNSNIFSEVEFDYYDGQYKWLKIGIKCILLVTQSGSNHLESGGDIEVRGGGWRGL